MMDDFILSKMNVHSEYEEALELLSLLSLNHLFARPIVFRDSAQCIFTNLEFVAWGAGVGNGYDHIN